MSQPNIPDITPEISINREDVINLIIASIAMEEMGLSHIINAEGEKLQYVLGTLPGNNLTPPASINDILAVNESVRQTLREISRKEQILNEKLETALRAEIRTP
ncbi:hypothetical protein ACFSTH_18155 [Paenibacillus yanchengensis]|uniref:Uncharacterized protein n=1 Tax=Paenibacillus yanchengensis TaxID=2035833 RepID=A0ABW4YP53_9BACL